MGSSIIYEFVAFLTGLSPAIPAFSRELRMLANIRLEELSLRTDEKYRELVAKRL